MLERNASFLANQDRSRGRYYMSLKEAQRNEDRARLALDKRMDHAAALKSRCDARREIEIRKQRENEGKKQLRQSQSLQKLDMGETRRIAKLETRFGREEATMRRLQWKQQRAVDLAQERSRLNSASLEERHLRQERVRQKELEEIQQRHEITEERVRLFMEKKHAESQERKDAALRGCFERQEIKMNSRGELVDPPLAETNSRWVERLRLGPAPASPRRSKR